MGKYPIYAILAGMLLTLASCIPVAGSLYRMAVPVAPERFELSTGGQTHLNQPVGAAGHVMLVLVFEIPPGGIPDPGVRYRVEASNGDQTQQRLTGVLHHQVSSQHSFCSFLNMDVCDRWSGSK